MNKDIVIHRLEKQMEKIQEYGEYCRKTFIESEKEILAIKELINYLKNIDC